MTGPRFRLALAGVLTIALGALASALVAMAGPIAPQPQSPGWRTISFETSQVSSPEVAVSPDGQWLVFTMLGKLFRLPVRGGEAEQLTTGPSWDASPAISPDGRSVAFASDRDSSAGNIFLLDLATRAVTPLTREAWADRPSWSPDGRSVVYLKLERTAWRPVDSIARPQASIRRQPLAGGNPETLRPLARVHSAFHLADGRVAWTLLERDSTSRRISTTVETLGPAGAVVTLRRFAGALDPVFAGPKGNGLYGRFMRQDDPPGEPDLVFASLAGDTLRRVAPTGQLLRFGVAADNSALFAGSLGRLWRIGLPGGRRDAIPMRARVTLTVREPTAPPKWTPGAPGGFRTIQRPLLSPDGSTLVFRALDRLYRQALAGGPALRVVSDSLGTERDAAFSPDGRRLAFVRVAGGTQEIRVLELRSGVSRSLTPNARCQYEQLIWSSAAELIAAQPCGHDSAHAIVAIDPAAGTLQRIATAGLWEPAPQLSADGKTLYYLANPNGQAGFYRLARTEGAGPELLFRLHHGAEDGIAVRIQGDRMARPIPNQAGFEIARIRGSAIEPIRTAGTSDADEVAFTPDGRELLLIEGNRLWREPVAGGPRREIPIRLSHPAPVPVPVLIKNVRVLDYASGGFGAETTVLLEDGRIRWIRPPGDIVVPKNTIILDGGGRYAIPGLFDSHGHAGGCGGLARIAHGVTSVRNLGGRLNRQNMAADRSDYTAAPVPRCFYPGRIFEGPNGASRDEDWAFVWPKDEADIRAHVRAWHRDGAQFIKLYNWVSWPMQRAAEDEARRLGLPVEAHGGTPEQAAKSVTLGYHALTHWSVYFGDDVAQMFAAAGTLWDPTMGAIGGYPVHYRMDPERFRRAWRGNERLPDNLLRGRWAETLNSVGNAYRRGVTLLPGTDRGPDGLALLWELEFYEEAGIPPLDILRFATQAAATAVGAGAELGSIEAGKLADLVLLDANPLEGIRNAQKIWRVIKGGWVFDPRVLLPNPN